MSNRIVSWWRRRPRKPRPLGSGIIVLADVNADLNVLPPSAAITTPRDRPVDAMGVIRQSFTITEEDAASDDVVGELVGSLMLTFPEDQLVTGEFVIYTLGLDRLRDLLHMAAAGHDIDGLLLSLDAVALASDEDGDGPEPATGG